MIYTLHLPSGAKFSLLPTAIAEGAETQPDCYRKVWPRKYWKAAIRSGSTTERITQRLWELRRSKRQHAR